MSNIIDTEFIYWTIVTCSLLLFVGLRVVLSSEIHQAKREIIAKIEERKGE